MDVGTMVHETSSVGQQLFWKMALTDFCQPAGDVISIVFIANDVCCALQVDIAVSNDFPIEFNYKDNRNTAKCFT